MADDEFKVDHIEPYEDISGEHRWRAVAKNGRIVADSGEGYKNKQDMMDVVFNLFPHVRIEENDG